MNEPCQHGYSGICTQCRILDLESKLDSVLSAADRLAHESLYSPAHETYWQARGGHDKCTVCSPECGAVVATIDGEKLLCSRDRGHEGNHCHVAPEMVMYE